MTKEILDSDVYKELESIENPAIVYPDCEFLMELFSIFFFFFLTPPENGLNQWNKKDMYLYSICNQRISPKNRQEFPCFLFALRMPCTP